MSENMVRALLAERSVAYRPMLAKALGSATAGIWLSQLLYWSDKGKRAEQWIYKTRDDWAEETGLSLREVDGARERVKALDVVEERLAGVPATLHYRIKWDALECALQSYLESQAQPPVENGENPDSEESRFTKSVNLDSRKVSNLIDEKRESIPESTQRLPETTTTRASEEKTSSLVEVVKAWENAAGPLSKTLGDMLSDLADEHGAEPVAAAIKEAVKNKGYPNIAYVSAVLRNWASRGGQRTRAAPKPVRLEGGAIMLPVASRGGGDR